MSRVRLLAGIDVGTTGCKAAVVSLDGDDLTYGWAPTPWVRSTEGIEVSPSKLVDAALGALADALRAAPEGRVEALGVASMAESGVLADRHLRPCHNCIAWDDPRGEDCIADLVREFGADQYMARTGLRPKAMATIAKLRWLRTHRPDVLGAGRHWFNIAEWIVLQLGASRIAELSLASRTGLFDRDRQHWWEDAIEWSGAKRNWFVEPSTAGTPAGRAATAPEPARGATLAVAGHDHLAAAYGVGAVGPGDTFDSCGTSQVFVRAIEPLLDSARTIEMVRSGVGVGWHVAPDRYALLSSGLGGKALTRVLTMLGSPAGPALDELDEQALMIENVGELRLDDLDAPVARLEGIGWNTTPAHVWRAAVESVGRHDAASLRSLERLAGPTGRQIMAGGWSRSRLFRTVKRQAHGPIDWADSREPGARGAALLAGRGAGLVAP